MKNSSITRFNYVAGKAPKGREGSVDEVWEQIEQQVERVYEEAKEMLEAAKNRDMVEVLDGSLDVWYTNTYMFDLLEACGIDIKKARNMVLDNNDMKITSNIYLAMSTRDDYNAKGEWTKVNETRFEGEQLFTVIRLKDNKVMKLPYHESPDLDSLVPYKWKQGVADD